METCVQKFLPLDCALSSIHVGDSSSFTLAQRCGCAGQCGEREDAVVFIEQTVEGRSAGVHPLSQVGLGQLLRFHLLRASQ